MLCVMPGSDENVITEYRYGPGGRLDSLIAKNPATGDQITRYEYGTTLADSAIASNDLLRAEIYPDAEDSDDRVTYVYNRQGQRTRMRDQNGTVHEYEYDLLGRQTADKVNTLADGVDDAVLRIGQTYEVRGMAEKITSYSDAAGTTPVNEVENVYNDFAQLVTQYQEHDGAVNTATTPKVEYAYEDGSANTIRQTNMTYPSGNLLEYLYDDTAANQLSRIRTLEWDDTNICRYSYLGLATFVITDYLGPQIRLDYAMGIGADLYAGFDRFGRVIDHPWTRYGTPSSSSSSSSSSGPGEPNPVVHLKYGYDRASNRTYREDLAAQFYDKDFDELYEYDGMQRLKKFHRGRLADYNTVITGPVSQQGWQLDSTGNWLNFTQVDQSDPSQTLDQQRIANRANEITQIARTVGEACVTPSYDKNGNMSVIPQPKDPTLAYRGTWDAWNRLVKLVEPSGEGGWEVLAEYQYDGQKWRTFAKRYANGMSMEARHFYFSNNWQAIEERMETGPSTAVAERRFVWGVRWIDDLVLRDKYTLENGTLALRLYAVQDAKWNVTALLNETSDVAERFNYEAYGEPHVLSGSFESRGASLYGCETRYSGYRYDGESNLYCVRNRYLHYQLGQWISRDPIGLEGSKWNLFQYAMSRVLVLYDPSGLIPSVGDCLATGNERDCNGCCAKIPSNSFQQIECLWKCKHVLPGLIPYLPASDCKLDICCKRVATFSRGHCVIRFTEIPSGKISGCRGGPSASGSGDASGGGKPRGCLCCGNWGSVITACGKGQPSGDDNAEIGLFKDLAAAEKGGCLAVPLPPGQCLAVKKCVENEMQKIENKCYKYQPTGQNSNSTWRTAMMRCMNSRREEVPDPWGFQPGNSILKERSEARCYLTLTGSF